MSRYKMQTFLIFIVVTSSVVFVKILRDKKGSVAINQILQARIIEPTGRTKLVNEIKFDETLNFQFEYVTGPLDFCIKSPDSMMVNGKTISVSEEDIRAFMEGLRKIGIFDVSEDVIHWKSQLFHDVSNIWLYSDWWIREDRDIDKSNLMFSLQVDGCDVWFLSLRASSTIAGLSKDDCRIGEVDIIIDARDYINRFVGKYKFPMRL